jgi:hypothetical protein
MSHRVIKDSNVANGVNIMSAPLIGHTFVGLIEISDTNAWGQEIEKRNYCAAHMMIKLSKKPVSDEAEKEEKLINKGFTYVMFLAGKKHLSFIKRFESKAAAMSWVNKTGPIDKDQDGSLFTVERKQDDS